MIFPRMLVFFCLCTLICPHEGRAQVDVSTKSVGVNGAVAEYDISGILRYQYTVVNGSSSSGSVARFTIYIGQGQDAKQVDSSGLPTDPSFLAQISVVAQSNSTSTKVVPSTASAPLGWLCSLTSDGNVAWFPYPAHLEPGKSASGFSIYSRGLPSVRAFVAQPYIDVDDLSLTPPNGQPGDTLRYKNDLDAVIRSSSTTGYTIAPASPPAYFNSSEFLKTILGYYAQAVSVGWITDPGTDVILRNRLNDVQNALTKNDISTATRSLQSLLADVKTAQATASITPELTALMTYNVQYLLAQLQSVPPAIPGDINGDRQVDCLDVALVKAAFGKKSGQEGYDARANLNGDSIIDIRDLTVVSQHLPVGTRCP